MLNQSVTLDRLSQFSKPQFPASLKEYNAIYLAVVLGRLSYVR